MSLARLHPEELLDRAAAGALSKVDAMQLDAHLAECAACRLELRTREDFRSVPMPAIDTDALIRAAFAMAPRPIVARRRAAPRYAAAASLLLALVVGGAAVASPFGRALVARVTGTAFFATSRAVEASPPAPAPHARPAFVITKTIVAEAIAPLPPQDEIDQPRQAPVSPSLPAVPAAAPPADDREPSAAELFDRAAALRRSGDHQAAAVAYRTLIDRHPRSAEATQAFVALGRLLLDDQQAAAALALFDRYLALGALSLEEEALSLRARSLAELGRGEDERAAWRRLLERFPDSVLKDRATDRLDRLEHR